MIFKTMFKKAKAAHADHAGHDDGHHVVPLPVYYAVFAVLLVFTIITVWVSTLGLPPTFSIIVAMVVATIKAALVVGYFMHLKYDDKFHVLIFFATLFFVGLFFVGTLFDMSQRGLIIEEQENGVMQKYEGVQAQPLNESQQPAPVPSDGGGTDSK